MSLISNSLIAQDKNRSIYEIEKIAASTYLDIKPSYTKKTISPASNKTTPKLILKLKDSISSLPVHYEKNNNAPLQRRNQINKVLLKVKKQTINSKISTIND